MLGAGWLNLGSLVLGLVAWAIPVVHLIRRNQSGQGRCAAYSAASFGVCAVALYLQMLYTNHLVKIADWSALMDTNNAVTLAANLLLDGTVALNAAVLIVCAWKKFREGKEHA